MFFYFASLNQKLSIISLTIPLDPIDLFLQFFLKIEKETIFIGLFHFIQLLFLHHFSIDWIE